LLDIAQIYVEDIFDYDPLLLSGESPGSPFKDEPVKKLYWSKKTGETKKLNCMNFDHDCPPEDIESELLKLKNAIATGDLNEGLLYLFVYPFKRKICTKVYFILFVVCEQLGS
jgi:hypothetical protein